MLTLLEVDLFGVCPEKAIKYPRINVEVKDANELSAGHTHMFMLNRAGDLTDEEEDEKKKLNEVVILGEQVDKKKKKKLDVAASMIQKAWKRKSKRISEL